VTKIVRDLKDFSRVGEANWQWANIHEGLDSTLNIVRNEVKYKANVTKHYGQLPKIYCLPSQLNQVFMNLLVNAAHAIPERGDIIITTRMATEHTVQIEISDSGTGMHPETIQHIFEPFFTTKGVGKGTGLGLSIAYGIIAKHHGRIEVESHVGRGTTFTITLSIRPPEAVELPSPELDNPVGN
jgi:signal transduction histidine kinase